MFITSITKIAMKKDTDNLLARYFGGNATAQDMQELERWISLSDENQATFDQLTDLYAKLGTFDTNTPFPNSDRAKQTFMAYILKQKDSQKPEMKVREIPFYNNWMFRAAGILVFVLFSFSIWKNYFSEHEMVLATQTNIKQDVLPDQTQVKLSKNSKISYSSNFGKKSKIIHLEGEAKFIVGHEGRGTLQVCADETFIEDIGTTFDVTAYPDSNYISVKVREGEVRFYTKNNKGITLTANETGIYNKDSKQFRVLAQKMDTRTTGSMHVEFQDMVLKDAIEIITNAYNVNIQLAEKSIGNRKITVNFDGEDVNVVLQIIAETLELELKNEPNGYLLCNKKNKL